jgi:hypothetical protein
MPNFPNRCQHLKINGTQCGSPALRRNPFCYFHKLHQEERVELNLDRLKDARARRHKVSITLPILEDANSIQVSLMQIMRLIISGQIDRKTAGLLLYALQTASSNLPRTNFQPYRHEVILDVKAVNQTPLGSNVWEDEDFLTDQDEDEDEENPDPRPGFTPRTPAEARNQPEIDRWGKAEADRLAILGARHRKAERQVQLLEDQFEAEREAAREAAEQRQDERLRAAKPALASAAPAATVTPEGRAILPAQPPPPPAKRPPAKQTLDEVRKKVNAQIIKALPAIAAAVKANAGHSG